MRLLPAIALSALSALAGEFRITGRYLHIPVALEGDLRTVQLLDGARIVHYFRIALPAGKSAPLFWTSIDVRDLKGRTITARIAGHESACRDQRRVVRC